MELPFGQPLADAYIGRRDSALEALFGYHPADGLSWRRRLDYLKGSADRRAGSTELAGALRAFQQPLGLSEPAERNLERLADGAPVVVGGQQAVLWTGPLMILYKAVTIVQAARAASERLGVPVVPVFWIAGEDHDWDEACLACLPSPLDAPGLRRLAVPRPSGAATSVSRTRLSAGAVEAALAELEAGLADTPFKPELLRSLRARAAGCGTLTELFAAMLSDLFADEGLLLADADHPALRRLEGPMFRRLAESSGPLAEAYAASSRRVEALGYAAQAEAAEDAANLFLFAEAPRAGERLLLQRAGGRFRDRRGLVSLTESELLELAESQPERLSNNVLTRPLMQDYLFPVLSTVLGPGEIAYWAQTSGGFEHLGMQMPIVTPRLSFTLLEPHAAKTMARYSLELEQVAAGLGGVKAELLDRQGAEDIRKSFGQALQAMREAYLPALAVAAGQERGLELLGRTNWERIAREIGYMEAKTLQALENRERAELDRLTGLELSAAPEGRPQERVLASVYFMNRYGRGWLDRLLAEPYEPCAEHGVMRLG